MSKCTSRSPILHIWNCLNWEQWTKVIIVVNKKFYVVFFVWFPFWYCFSKIEIQTLSSLKMTNLIDVLYETSIASINIFIHRTVNTHTSVHTHTQACTHTEWGMECPLNTRNRLPQWVRESVGDFWKVYHRDLNESLTPKRIFDPNLI